jgi:hypothetical protein
LRFFAVLARDQDFAGDKLISRKDAEHAKTAKVGKSASAGEQPSQQTFVPFSCLVSGDL